MHLPRECCEQAIAAAVGGQRVAVFCDFWLEKEVLRDFECVSPPDWSVQHVWWEPGRRSIEFVSGGSIRIFSSQSSLRGYSFHQVFVPLGACQEVLDAIYLALRLGEAPLLTTYDPSPATHDA